jgi:hypothetical protein
MATDRPTRPVTDGGVWGSFVEYLNDLETCVDELTTERNAAVAEGRQQEVRDEAGGRAMASDWAEGLGTVRTQYDDARRLAFEPSINGEVVIRLAGHEPIFVFAEDLRTAATWACDEAIAALPNGATNGC